MSSSSQDTRPVALVTGASRGIGRRTALQLAAAGYDVAFTARTRVEGQGTVPPRTRHEDAAHLPVSGSLATTTAEVEALGMRALAIPMDLTDLVSVRGAAHTVLTAWGRVDVLVNNAIAHVPHSRLLELDLDDVRLSLEANLLHQVALVQELLPAMVRDGGGTIVNLCSGSATTDPSAPPGEGGWGLGYSASKAAFGRLAGAINAEYAALGVRAFNLDPGFVLTESARARGGTTAIVDTGFETASDDAAGQVAVWLAARSPGTERFLGRTIWAPRLARDLESGSASGPT